MASGIYPTLNVSDIERSHAFYKALGLRTRVDSMEAGPGVTMRWVTVSAGEGHALMLSPRDFPGADPEDVAWASGDVGRGVLLTLEVADARRTYEKAKAAGLRAESEPEPNPWGGYGFQIADPDGYYLMVMDSLPPDIAKENARSKTAKKAAKGRKPAKKAARGRKSAKKSPARKPTKKAAAKKTRRAR